MQADSSKKSTQLRSQLTRWEGLSRICKGQDYQLYLKPILEQAFQNKWLDPNSLDKEGKPLFPTMEAFHKAYSEEWGQAKAFKEVYNILENAEVMARNLAEQIKSPTKDYSLGQKDETASDRS